MCSTSVISYMVTHWPARPFLGCSTVWDGGRDSPQLSPDRCFRLLQHHNPTNFPCYPQSPVECSPSDWC